MAGGGKRIEGENDLHIVIPSEFTNGGNNDTTILISTRPAGEAIVQIQEAVKSVNNNIESVSNDVNKKDIPNLKNVNPIDLIDEDEITDSNVDTLSKETNSSSIKSAAELLRQTKKGK